MHADRVAMGANARGLSQQRHISVAYNQTPRGKHPHHRRNKPAAVCATPLRVGIGKVLTDVAQARGTQQRITQGVQQHVAIGVRDHTMIMSNADATEHYRIARPEGMCIETRTHFDVHARSMAAVSNACASGKSAALVTLIFVLRPSTNSGL